MLHFSLANYVLEPEVWQVLAEPGIHSCNTLYVRYLFGSFMWNGDTER